MKKISSMAALLFCFVELFSQLPIKECSGLQGGTFKYVQGDSITYFIIDDTSHTEYHHHGKYIIKSKIKWLSKCEYKLILIACTLPNFSYVVGSELVVTINDIRKNKVLITSKTSTDQWDSEVIKISNEHLPLYHPDFGKYFQIDSYPVYAPFKDDPHISPVDQSAKFKSANYTYIYAREEDDLNIGYGVNLLQIPDPSFYKDYNAMLEYALATASLTYKSQFDATIVEQNKIKYNGYDAYSQKAFLTYEGLGDMYLHSLIFIYNDLMVRLFVMVPSVNDNNHRINDFFDSIIYN